MNSFNDPNEFSGTDNERIASALAASAQNGFPVMISPRIAGENTEERDFWLLDSAILLESDTTLILNNVTLKLSDRCRDNFIRSANCGNGIRSVAPLRNIHILGIGDAKLIGADRPRATGDSAKTLGVCTWGSDAGKSAQKQTGDWRNIGVLLSQVRNFSLENFCIVDSHCWAVSLERCRNGKIRDLSFHSDGAKFINEKKEMILNQDGLDLRQGCRDIIIENITGKTGDDLLAITAITGNAEPGSLDSTMVSGTKLSGDEDHVRNIIIRNVSGTCTCGHHIVRFLNSGGIRIENVVLDGVLDTSVDDIVNCAAVKIGDSNPVWGGVTPLGDTSSFLIRNIISRSKFAILIAGSLSDSRIECVLNKNPQCDAVTFQSGRNMVRNCIFP